MLVQIIQNSDEVISNATLLTLEKILFMRDINSQASLAKDAVNNQQTFGELIGSLVNIVANKINIFAIRCFFRTVFLTSDTYYRDILGHLSESMNNILKLIISNPTEDQFNYFLFETISLILKKLSSNDPQLYCMFEAAIKANLLMIITNNITDLMGYAFQILALELSLSSGNIDTIHIVKNTLFNI